MTSSEDVLLKEVDEDLKQDEQVKFLKTYGPWLAGAAAILVGGVGVQQFMASQSQSAMAASAEAYAEALLEGEADTTVAADALDQLRPQLAPGYRGLAGLREAALRAATGQAEEAVVIYRSVYQDSALPDRLRDLARARAGYIMAETDPGSASALADEIATEAFKDHAREIKAIAALGTGAYEEAYGLFSALAAEGAPSIAARAKTLAPLADAGRKGISLETETSEAESFLDAFSEQLGADGLLPSSQPLPAVPDATADSVAEEEPPVDLEDTLSGEAP